MYGVVAIVCEKQENFKQFREKLIRKLRKPMKTAIQTCEILKRKRNKI